MIKEEMHSSAASAKKNYTTPRLRRYGTIEELTKQRDDPFERRECWEQPVELDYIRWSFS